MRVKEKDIFLYLQQQRNRQTMDMPIDTISYTYFCRYIFREIMRNLRDTELRVLLTVADKTLGWNKENDWINRTLLKSLTGKGNTALVSAITILTNRELIDTFDENGKILKSPKERQIYGYTHHNTYFRINPAFIQKAIKYFSEKRTLTHSHSEHNKLSSLQNNLFTKEKSGEELTPYKTENTMVATVADQIAEWMCRGIYTIEKSRDEVYLQVKHTIEAHGVKEIQEIYNRIANRAYPGHPREFWNEIRALKANKTIRKDNRVYGLGKSEPQLIGDIIKSREFSLPFIRD